MQMDQIIAIFLFGLVTIRASLIHGEQKYISHIDHVVKVAHFRNNVAGWWTKDSQTSKYYVLKNCMGRKHGPKDCLTVYESETDLMYDKKNRSLCADAEGIRVNTVNGGYELFECDGTGHVLHGNYFYCVGRGNNHVYRMSLSTQTIRNKESEFWWHKLKRSTGYLDFSIDHRRRKTGHIRLQNAGIQDEYSYKQYCRNSIDLKLDNGDIYALYSTSEQRGNITIAKLDWNEEKIATKWNTKINKMAVRNAFILSGVLYTYDTPAHINYIYDMNLNMEKHLEEDELALPDLHYNAIYSMSYVEGYLYIWDDGHLLKYPVELTDEIPKWHPKYVDKHVNDTNNDTDHQAVPRGSGDQTAKRSVKEDRGKQINYSCECEFRVKDRNCSGDPGCAGFPVLSVPGYTATIAETDTCSAGCLRLIRECPHHCSKQARLIWGSEGLNTPIHVHMHVKANQTKILAQHACEQLYTEIPQPGAFVFAAAVLPDCDVIMIDQVFDDRLCCAMLALPVIGNIPVWDPKCTGTVTTKA